MFLVADRTASEDHKSILVGGLGVKGFGKKTLAKKMTKTKLKVKTIYQDFDMN